MSRVKVMHPAEPIGDAKCADVASRSTARRAGALWVALVASGLLSLPASAAAPAQASATAAPAAHAKKSAKGPAQPAAPVVSPYARAAAQHARAPQTAGAQGPTAMQASGKSRTLHSPRTVTKRH
jgi:hypothetical protein